jgi:hypothetical protein
MFFFALASLSKVSNSRKAIAAEHGSGPGAEILGGDVISADLLQIRIDVGRGDGLFRAGLVDVLEQVLPGQFLALAHDLGDAPVLDLQPPRLAALALEVEFERGAVDLDMAVAQGRQAEALVLFDVVLVADPDQCGFEKDAPRAPALFPAASRAAP